jgi:hypothetical protein
LYLNRFLPLWPSIFPPVLGFSSEEGLCLFHGHILNLECPYSQKVEPIGLKVAIYRNYLSGGFIPSCSF